MADLATFASTIEVGVLGSEARLAVYPLSGALCEVGSSPCHQGFRKDRGSLSFFAVQVPAVSSRPALGARSAWRGCRFWS